MSRHPMGEGVDPNPRFVSERLVDVAALIMGVTAENLHDRFPHLTSERADAFGVRSQELLAKAYADGVIQGNLVPVATRSAEKGWGLATADEPPRPGTTMADLANLKTPFRVHGRVTAATSSPLNDGATAALCRRRGRRRGVRPGAQDAAGRRTPSPGSPPRSWASAPSPPPSGPCATPG